MVYHLPETIELMAGVIANIREPFVGEVERLTEEIENLEDALTVDRHCPFCGDGIGKPNEHDMDIDEDYADLRECRDLFAADANFEPPQPSTCRHCTRRIALLAAQGKTAEQIACGDSIGIFFVKDVLSLLQIKLNRVRWDSHYWQSDYKRYIK